MIWPMVLSSNLRRSRYCVYELHVHLVFVTKYRKKVFTKRVLKELNKVFESVCLDFKASLEEFDGENDHVHLLVYYPPKVSISKLINALKGVSSRMIKKKNYPEITKALYKGALWSPSYFASSCGGASIEVVKKYIQEQNTPRN